MGILNAFLLVVFVLDALLLVFMVVIQNEDADGLGGIFAGSSSTAFGSRSSNVMQRFTYVLGALFFVCAFSLALLDKGSTGNVEAAALKNAPTQSASTEWWKGSSQQSAPATPAPASTAPTGAAPATAPSGLPTPATSIPAGQTPPSTGN